MQKRYNGIYNKCKRNQNNANGNPFRKITLIGILHNGRGHYNCFPGNGTAHHRHSANFRNGTGKRQQIRRYNLINTFVAQQKECFDFAYSGIKVNESGTKVLLTTNEGDTLVVNIESYIHDELMKYDKTYKQISEAGSQDFKFSILN